MEGKCVLDVADADPISLDEHANDVEAIGVRGAAMPVDPDPRRTAQLLLLLPVDRLDGTAKPRAAPSLDLDERYQPVPLDYEIDVAVPAPEATLNHAPPPQPKPSLRDPLPQLAECLPGR